MACLEGAPDMKLTVHAKEVRLPGPRPPGPWAAGPLLVIRWPQLFVSLSAVGQLQSENHP